MKTEKQISLINGTFSAEETFEILSNMLDNKIHFHQVKNFGEMERNGTTNEKSLKRIEELKESLRNMKEMIKEAEARNKYLCINSVVEISFTEKPQTKTAAPEKSVHKQTKA